MRASQDGPPPTDFWNEAAGAPYGDPSHYAPENEASSQDVLQSIRPPSQRMSGPRVLTGARARRVETSFALGSRDDGVTIRKDRRSENAKGFAQVCATWIACSAIGVFIVFLSIWSWHMVCPMWLEFVPAAKMVWLSDLVKFGAGAALGATLMRYFAKDE